MNIRRFTNNDYDQIWEIFSKVIKNGDSFVFDPNTAKEDLKKHWLADYMETYILEENNTILGSYFIKPNQVDLGSHIANCGYMTNPEVRGNGIGGKLCEHSIKIARERSYEGMQFNIVVSSNTVAVDLWKKYGFEIIGTTPRGFKHLKLGFIDTYIMFKDLKK